MTDTEEFVQPEACLQECIISPENMHSYIKSVVLSRQLIQRRKEIVVFQRFPSVFLCRSLACLLLKTYVTTNEIRRLPS